MRGPVYIPGESYTDLQSVILIANEAKQKAEAAEELTGDIATVLHEMVGDL